MDAFQAGLSRGIPAKTASAYFVDLKRWQPLSPENDELMAACVKEAAVMTGLATRPRLSDQYPAGERGARKSKTAGLLEQFRKIAAEESTHHSGEMATPTPADDDPMQAYAEQEQAAMQAEEQNASGYYQQVLQGLRAQLAEMQEHAQGLEQQNQQLTEQQAGHDNALQTAQQETQLAQQAALEQTQSAAAQATQSMQQAVDAENRALQSKAQEAAAKIQQQQVRSQLFDLASQGLPGSEPQIAEGTAAEGLQPAQAPAQPGAEQGVPGDPNAAPAEPGAPGAEQAAAGEQGAEGAPNAGLNEAGQPANAEGMPGQNASSEAAGAAAPPGAVQPPDDSSGGAGAGSGTGPQAPSEGNPQNPNAKRTGQVSIKVGGASPVSYSDVVAFLEGRHGRPLPDPQSKTAGVGATMKEWALKKVLESPAVKAHERKLVRDASLAVGGTALAGGYVGHRLASKKDRPKTASALSALRNPAVIGGVAGGALGLGMGALEATGHGPDLNKLRTKVEGQEERMKQPGLRNFGEAFNVVFNRMLLTHGEAVKSHPVLGTLASGAAGAAMGAEAGHELPALLREAKGWHTMGRPPVG